MNRKFEFFLKLVLILALTLSGARNAYGAIEQGEDLLKEYEASHPGIGKLLEGAKVSSKTLLDKLISYLPTVDSLKSIFNISPKKKSVKAVAKNNKKKAKRSIASMMREPLLASLRLRHSAQRAQSKISPSW